MRDRIVSALAGSHPPKDPVAEALAGDLPELARQHIRKVDLVPAAVLIGLVHDDEWRVVLTQRAQHLSHHPGQISFPGGRLEERDEGPAETALRESEEEIGLSRKHVELVGYLSPYITITRYVVTPVVGFLRDGFSVQPDGVEVDEVFEVPLEFLLDPANRKVQTRRFMGADVRYYEIPWEGRNIWGATAAMIVGFGNLLKNNK